MAILEELSTTFDQANKMEVCGETLLELLRYSVNMETALDILNGGVVAPKWTSAGTKAILANIVWRENKWISR